MNRIFIETKNNKTPEYHFLMAILNSFFPDKEIEFIFMDGIGNLFNETNINLISQSQITGDQVLVGSGDWLFGNINYWNLNSEALIPLKEFLSVNIK